MSEWRFKNGGSFVSNELAAKRQQDSKHCAHCKRRFFRRGDQIPSRWERQRFCSRECVKRSVRAFSLDKFMSKVQPEPNSGCWLWDGFVDAKGYGTFCNDAKKTGAHRASWQIFRGPIPTGLSILHACDMPQCVNPDHLFLGTQADNLRDAREKGRLTGRKGSLHPLALLNEADVVRIRNDTRLAKLIAADYGVSIGAIRSILKRRNWAHVQ